MTQRARVFSHVAVPIFTLDAEGAVRPNPLFHRPSDKLHSRCVEYPFAASRAGGAAALLDVGTAKADDAWVDWLAQLPIEVCAVDYDPPTRPTGPIRFYRADVRSLPLEGGRFDRVLAVSVIEHIGLADPQVLAAARPAVDEDGDLAAVRELARVLRPGGELVMTVPFGPRAGPILGGQARCYSRRTLRRFDALLRPVALEYYEYQYAAVATRYDEYPRLRIVGRLRAALLARLGARRPAGLGAVAWRRTPIERAAARHRGHVDGVACGVWRKE